MAHYCSPPQNTIRINRQILLLDGQGKDNHRDGRGLSHQGLGLRTEPRTGVHHQTGQGQYTIRQVGTGTG